jgi:hypothetical protein
MKNKQKHIELMPVKIGYTTYRILFMYFKRIFAEKKHENL